MAPAHRGPQLAQLGAFCMVLEHRSFPLDQVAVELRQDDDSPRTISWYPALFDTLSEDLGGFRERIGRRAFTASVRDHDVRALVNHDPNLILGRTSKGTVKLGVDLRGLHAEATLPQTSYVSDLVANIDSGNISGGSFGFRATKDVWRLENIEGEEEPVLVRTVNELRLYDVSLVTFPAYPATEGSAALRSLALEWRAKLTGEPIETREMDMCAAVKAMCATCEASDCAMNQSMMGERELPVVDMSRYRRQLELQKLRYGGC